MPNMGLNSGPQDQGSHALPTEAPHNCYFQCNYYFIMAKQMRNVLLPKSFKDNYTV